MRELLYEHCERCACPLVLLSTDMRKRTLCVRCHVDLAAKANRHKRTCTCALIEQCKTCKDREYSFSYRQKNQKRISGYWMDYYYANWEAMLAKQKVWAAAKRARQRQAKRDASECATIVKSATAR